MYFRVVNSQIKAGPIELPATWTDPQSNIKYDMASMSSVELSYIGWLPIVSDPTPIREPYDTIKSQSFNIVGNEVHEVISLNPLSIQDIIQQKSRIISEYADTWLDGTFAWNGEIWFGDEPSRQNITGITSAIANGVPIPEGFTWTNSSYAQIPMDAPALVAMGATMLTWVNICYKTKYYHIAAISAMSDENQIIAYDHTVGWPI